MLSTAGPNCEHKTVQCEHLRIMCLYPFHGNASHTCGAHHCIVVCVCLYVYACLCTCHIIAPLTVPVRFLKATMFFDLSLLKLDKAHWHSENLQKAQTVKHTLTGFGAGEVLATKSSRLEIRPGLSFKIIWGVASTCSLQRRILTGVDIVFINTYTCMYIYMDRV